VSGHGGGISSTRSNSFEQTDRNVCPTKQTIHRKPSPSGWSDCLRWIVVRARHAFACQGRGAVAGDVRTLARRCNYCTLIGPGMMTGAPKAGCPQPGSTIVAVGAAIGGHTGMAAAVARRKQLKSQQLQPVAAAVSIATADKTNSFLMIGLLGKNGSRRVQETTRPAVQRTLAERRAFVEARSSHSLVLAVG